MVEAVLEGLGLLLGFDQDLERFANLLTTFKVVLGDDEEKQFSNRAIEIWLQNLKDAVLELEDIMNEYAYEEVKYCLRLPEMVPERSGVIDWCQTNSLITKQKVYGSEKDTLKIVQFLFGKASRSENLSVYPIICLGKEIVKKCWGMPLAAKAMRGLLSFKRNKIEWLNVKQSSLLELSYNENSIMNVLRLSYLNLPIKHRQYENIDKQYLIEWWMANGFISSNRILGDAEDVDDSVWNELYLR
ncbi:putative disease resistance protein RGA3 [Glycine soja]|uniref:Disease resistance N-terminal domain-containing protein n=2 Tax=Glycine subgen. Soja TaxID=1462606 RepID=K7KE03_SOYBN|nr:putative disease resistance protein RGA3 [Glycine soja]